MDKMIDSNSRNGDTNEAGNELPESKDGLDRRAFLKSAVAAAGAASVAGHAAAADSPADGKIAKATTALVKEKKPRGERTIPRPGSDFMVDVIKTLNLDYVSSNPGSSFRSLHESTVNYGGNKKPEFITCMHEESSVALAHGYAKAAGKPMAVYAHGTVGLQHASMAIYNAWCDRVPIIMFAGNGIDANKRRPGT